MLQYYIFSLILGWEVLFHPFYISLTEIRHNGTNENLEISQKIFWDDLEVALADVFNTKVDFLNPSDPETLNNMVEIYLLSKFEIQVNDQKAKLTYLGYEIEEDAAWFYLESEKIQAPKKVSVTNIVLLQHFEEQQNIINFYKENRPKSLILHKGKPTGILNF